MKVCGVDPGVGVKGSGTRATATGGTGVVLIEGARVLHAETILRNPLETYDGYARRLVIRVREIAGDAVVAVEVPQEMYGGRARRYVVPTAVLAGQLVAALKARVVKPAGFGKNRPLEDHYPPDLWGYRLTADRHRADSQGSKTRDHERAAYDIARFVQAELEAAAA